MSQKYKNKYRTQSTRLQGWDYGSNASYFITICTKNRVCSFGEVVNSEMQLTEIGEIAVTEWLKTVEMRKDMNLEMGAFVVMPNHFHAVIGIGENVYNTGGGAGIRNDAMDSGRDTMHCVSTVPHDAPPPPTDAPPPPTDAPPPPTDATPPPTGTPSKNKFGPQSKNLASIVRGYKSSVKRYATMHNIEFAWQPLYHDHIIRNKESYKRILDYIKENPQNWAKDTFFQS